MISCSICGAFYAKHLFAVGPVRGKACDRCIDEMALAVARYSMKRVRELDHARSSAGLVEREREAG